MIINMTNARIMISKFGILDEGVYETTFRMNNSSISHLYNSETLKAIWKWKINYPFNANLIIKFVFDEFKEGFGQCEEF